MAVRGVYLGVLVVVTAMLVHSAMGVSTEDAYKAWLDAQAVRVGTVETDTAVPDVTIDGSLPAGKSCVLHVGKKGSGAKYKKVKTALKAIPTGSKKRCYIMIGPGTYTERITVTADMGKVTFQGTNAAKTVITNDYTAERAGTTSLSATMAVMSDYFKASDITIANSAPAPVGGAVGQQAVAFRVEGKFAQFNRVGFLGAQDTLYDKNGTHYFKDCYIEGSIDFIFGAGLSYYETCHLHSIATPYSGSLTAQKKTTKSEMSGFSFVRCLITGTGPIYLGRAWGAYSEVVFSYCQIDAPILPAGWFDWAIPARQKTVYYGQYMCTGVGANTTGRVSWSHELTAKEAAPFLSWNFVMGKSWINKD